MLYMIGKVFLYGISFNIAYNKLGHKNMTNFEYFVSHRKNINLVITEIGGWGV